jgi:hypothetical protein
MTSSRPNLLRLDGSAAGASIVLLLTLAGLFVPAAVAQPSFRVTLAEPAAEAERDGRLVVYLIADDAELRPTTAPASGPFFRDPQPMFGIDVRDFGPGDTVLVGSGPGVTSFPASLAELPPGGYRAQTVFDAARANSSWRREPGNVSSAVVPFELPARTDPAWRTFTVDLRLDNPVRERSTAVIDASEALRLIDVRSELLSDFRGEEVRLRGLAVLPRGFDPAKRYPVVYVVPGFGGDHWSAMRETRRRRLSTDADRQTFESRAILIWLDPESGNGHTLFADSAVNGPVGRALVEEFVPAVDAALPTIAEPGARLLRGHSSGGWSVLWLALSHPETFGHAFSSAPDPVDFRAFQSVNIYEDASAYVDAAGRERPSYERDGRVHMSKREENRMEEVLGPRNTSGQQWDSWFAVFGPRDHRGEPAALWDAQTGAIDHDVAAAYRRYDIAHLVRSEPDRFAPIFRSRIRLIVGEEDQYALDDAVRLLAADLDEALPAAESDAGFILFEPGADHGTIFRTPAAQRLEDELRRVVSRAYVRANDAAADEPDKGDDNNERDGEREGTHNDGAPAR